MVAGAVSGVVIGSEPDVLARTLAATGWVRHGGDCYGVTPEAGASQEWVRPLGSNRRLVQRMEAPEVQKQIKMMERYQELIGR